MKYVILELIPTSLNPEKGEIIQLSALKIDDLKLIDRFDYRIVDSKVPLDSMLEMISYDKDKFIYKDSKEEIVKDFIEWIEDYKLLFMDNQYTLAYLSDIKRFKGRAPKLISYPMDINFSRALSLNLIVIFKSDKRSSIS